VLRHQLEGRQSLASLAVRYGSTVNELKRLNNLLTESGVASRQAGCRCIAVAVADLLLLHSRSAGAVALPHIRPTAACPSALCRNHIYIPLAAAAAAGRRVAFLQDENSKRRLVVVLAEGQEALPPGRPKQPRSRSSPAVVVDKLAAVLQRALRIDQSTATFYVQQAGCDVRAAIEKVRCAAGPSVTGTAQQLTALRPAFSLARRSKAVPRPCAQQRCRCPPNLM
jgi:hypothetical protein